MMMTREDCVDGLKHMAAYKSLSLCHVKRHGLEGTVLEKEQFVAVEESQLRVLQTAILLISGEQFTPPQLPENEESEEE